MVAGCSPASGPKPLERAFERPRPRADVGPVVTIELGKNIFEDASYAGFFSRDTGWSLESEEYTCGAGIRQVRDCATQSCALEQLSAEHEARLAAARDFQTDPFAYLESCEPLNYETVEGKACHAVTLALRNACADAYAAAPGPGEQASCPDWRYMRAACGDPTPGRPSPECDEHWAYKADFIRFGQSFGALFVEEHQRKTAAVKGCPPALFEAVFGHEDAMNNSDPRLYIALRQGEEMRFMERAEDLAPIDTPQKAIVALLLEGFQVQLGGTPVRSSRRGFDVQIPEVEHDTTPIGGCEMEYETRRYRDVQRVDAQGEYKRVRHHLESREAGIDDSECHQHGRRAEGARAQDWASARSCQRAYLQRVAEDEAEAIVAFERLVRELEHHGASHPLINAARGAVADERKHVERVCAFAAAQGFTLTAEPRRRALPLRDLEAVLTENAVEGAVLETYAAALALHQSTHATTEAARDLFDEIARDEFDHAALAHAISSELLPRLDPVAQTRVLEAQQHALERLAAASPTEPSPVEVDMGHPPPAFRQAFASQLQAAMTR